MTFYLCLLVLWFVGAFTFVILLISCGLACIQPRLLLNVCFLKTTLICYYFAYTLVLFMMLTTAFNKLAQLLLSLFPFFNKSKFTDADQHRKVHEDHPDKAEAE